MYEVILEVYIYKDVYTWLDTWIINNQNYIWSLTYVTTALVYLHTCMKLFHVSLTQHDYLKTGMFLYVALCTIILSRIPYCVLADVYTNTSVCICVDSKSQHRQTIRVTVM